MAGYLYTLHLLAEVEELRRQIAELQAKLDEYERRDPAATIVIGEVS
jgi:hypothetical protein